jgi:hypothetical protein
MKVLMTHRALRPAPSPLEGEGWGGAYVAYASLLRTPPSRTPSHSLRRSTFPRGEVKKEEVARGEGGEAR